MRIPPRSWLAVVLAAPIALASASAFAQTAPPAPDAGERPTSLWYGWQTLAAVAPFDIAMFVGLARHDASYGPATFATGFVGRNLAPAAVHIAQRRPGVGFGSVGLHAVATATGLAVGYGVGIAVQQACPPRDPCRYGFRDIPPGLGYGAIAGSMVGTVMDVVFLARRARSVWGVTGSAPVGPSVAVSPFATQTAVGVAAGGVF